MADLFGALLGVANQDQAGQMQGQQLLRQTATQQEADKLAQRKQSFAEMLQAAQAGNYQSEVQDRTYKQQHPTIDPNSPEVFARKQAMETQKIKDENQFGYHAPVFGSYEQVQSTDANDKPIVSVLDKHTGTVTPTTTRGKPLAAAGGMADRTRAQLETASGQAALADQGMTAFENKVLSGQMTLNPLAMRLARAAVGGSTAAEATLNTLNPELASYVRFAKQVASAERMITPRGGSNALAQAEALLSGAGASGTPDQIKNAQQYRGALIHGLQSHGTGGLPATPQAAPTENPFGDLIPQAQ